MAYRATWRGLEKAVYQLSGSTRLGQKLGSEGVPIGIIEGTLLARLESPAILCVEVTAINCKSVANILHEQRGNRLLSIFAWVPEEESGECVEVLQDTSVWLLEERDFAPKRLSYLFERELAILKSAEAAEHLHHVMEAMRRIKRHEREATTLDDFIEHSCRTLVEARGYYHAWIYIADAHHAVGTAVQFGMNEDGPIFQEAMAQGRHPPCLVKASSEGVLFQMRDPSSDCGGCPLAKHYDGRYGMSARLSLGEGLWGFCTVSLPSSLAANPAEKPLFMELCDEMATLIRGFRDRERVHHLLEIIRNVPEALSMVSRDYCYRVVNHRYEEQFGLPAEKIIGRKVCHFFGETFFESAIRPQLDRAFAGESVRYEVSCNFIAKGQAWMEMVYIPYRNSQGEVEAVVVHGHDITQRKKMEETLRSQKEEFSAVIAASNLGTWIWHVDEGHIVINQRWGGMLGYPDLGREVTYEVWRDALHPEDLENVQQSLTAYLAHPVGVFEETFRMRHRLGHYIWVHGSGRLIPPSSASEQRRMCGIQLDVSDRIADYEHLKEAKKQLQLLLEALNSTEDGIVITRAEWPPGGPTIVFVSDGFCRLTGYQREELVGKTPGLLQSERTNFADVERLKQCLREGRSFEGETTNRRKDGTYYQVGWRVSPVRDESGKIIHYISVQRDISKQRDMEARVSLLTKMESIGQLAAGIAHEINTPSQFINDNLHFLQDCWKDAAPLLQKSLAGEHRGSDEAILDETFAEVPVALEDALEGVQRIKTIVTAMREFSHPQEKFVPTDLNHALETTSTVARNEWKYHSEVVFSLDPEMPLVSCVPGDLNQAILNLLVNASHAIKTRFGGDKRLGVIRLATKFLGERVRISVSDNGCGIPEKVRGRIFDPFFTTKGVGEGTGQGLYLAHNAIVKKHRGSLTFETELDVGSTFHIELPVEHTEVAE